MLVILIIGIVLLTVFAERTRLELLLKPPIRLLNTFGHKVLRRQHAILSPQRFESFLTDFYQGYHEIASHKRKWPGLLWWALGGNIAEISTIYCVFIGFGHWINPGVVITGYILAIIASIGGILINGLGVFEAGMIGTYAALGVPFALAFAVVIVYRVLNLLLFLPPGLFFYRRHLRESR
jgi:uncharacterized protein (TIRG00374 family)